MGVRGLQMYVEGLGGGSGCTAPCASSVCITSLAKARAEKSGGGTATLAIDGDGFLYFLTQYTGLDWLLGGQYAQLAAEVETWLSVFRANNISPVFFFDGMTEELKRKTSLERRAREAERSFSTLQRLSRSSSNLLQLPFHLFTMPFLAKETLLRTLRESKKENQVEVRVAAFEADLEIALYVAEEERCVGLLARDSDFMIFDLGEGKYYLPFTFLELRENNSSKHENENEKRKKKQTKRRKRKKVIRVASLFATLEEEDVAPISPECCGCVNWNGAEKKQTQQKEERSGDKQHDEKGDSLEPRYTLWGAGYEANSTASSLGFDKRWLPLFASMVGNDYTREAASMYHRQLGVRDNDTLRIVRAVASFLRSLKYPSLGDDDGNGEVLAEHVAGVLRALLQKERDKQRKEHLVQVTLDSISVYRSVSAASAASSSSDPSSSVNVLAKGIHESIFGHPSDEAEQPIENEEKKRAQEEKEQEVNELLRRFRKGEFGRELMSVLHGQEYWSRVLLCNFSICNVSSFFRPIRGVIYSILLLGHGRITTNDTSLEEQLQKQQKQEERVIKITEFLQSQETFKKEKYEIKGDLSALQQERPLDSDFALFPLSSSSSSTHRRRSFFLGLLRWSYPSKNGIEKDEDEQQEEGEADPFLFLPCATLRMILLLGSISSSSSSSSSNPVFAEWEMDAFLRHLIKLRRRSWRHHNSSPDHEMDKPDGEIEEESSETETETERSKNDKWKERAEDEGFTGKETVRCITLGALFQAGLHYMLLLWQALHLDVTVMIKKKHNEQSLDGHALHHLLSPSLYYDGLLWWRCYVKAFLQERLGGAASSSPKQEREIENEIEESKEGIENEVNEETEEEMRRKTAKKKRKEEEEELVTRMKSLTTDGLNVAKPSLFATRNVAKKKTKQKKQKKKNSGGGDGEEGQKTEHDGGDEQNRDDEEDDDDDDCCSANPYSLLLDVPITQHR